MLQNVGIRLHCANAFIPAAERFKLMEKIDHWVIANTINFMTKTSNQGINFSINLSGQTLNNSKAMKIIVVHIQKTDIKSDRICFEITETVMIANLSTAIEYLKKLRDLGCKVALDDQVNFAIIEAIIQIGKIMQLEIVAEFVENNSISNKLSIACVDYLQGYGVKPAPLKIDTALADIILNLIPVAIGFRIP